MAPTAVAPDKRQPKVVLRELKDDYCEFVLSNTDPSVANVLRRVIISHVPTIAVRVFRYRKSLQNYLAELLVSTATALSLFW